jgi:hypothetical protein
VNVQGGVYLCLAVCVFMCARLWVCVSGLAFVQAVFETSACCVHVVLCAHVLPTPQAAQQAAEAERARVAQEEAVRAQAEQQQREREALERARAAVSDCMDLSPHHCSTLCATRPTPLPNTVCLWGLVWVSTRLGCGDWCGCPQGLVVGVGVGVHKAWLWGLVWVSTRLGCGGWCGCPQGLVVGIGVGVSRKSSSGGFQCILVPFL